ncbi:MAG: T9SS type B sorting domain-containing protein, partial [Bacteroidota bacterium]
AAATSYTWTGPNGFSSFIQNPSIVNTSTPMAGTYTLSTTNTANCIPFLTQTINVVVNPTPTINVSNSTVCSGATASLIASGANSYTWNPGPLIGNSVTINPFSTTVYTVTGASVAGCSASATKTVFVPSTLTLNIAASAPSVCVGSNITLTASLAGGNPAYSFTWTGGPFTPVYNTTRPAGVYIYTVTGKDFNNCFAVKTTSLSFVAPPIVSAPALSICPGTTGTLTASGATSYTWRPGNIVGNPFMVTPLVSSTYTLVGAAAGCTAGATTTINLKPLPSLTFNTASITCASLGSATVNASGGGLGPYSYSWTPSGQTTSIAVNLNPGVYTLSVFDAGSGCTSASTTTFTSLIPFTGTLSATNSLSCNGISTATAGIVVAGGSGNQSYLWSSAPGTQTSSVATGLGAGIHTIVVTDAVTFCTVTETFQVTQPLPLSIGVLTSASLACVGANIVMTATASGGTAPFSYTWTSGPSNFIYATTQSSGGTYTYVVNASDANNCQASSGASLIFVDYPVLSVSSATICNGAVASLSVSGAQTYLWHPGGFSGNNINVAVSANTTYSVTGKTLGCATTATTTILVNAPPVPAINTSSSVCLGGSINLNASGVGTFLWQGPNSFSSASQNTLVAPVGFINAGVYSLTLTDNNNCSASTSTVIAVLANPVVSASGASVCIGEPATLSAFGGVSYFWTGPGGFSSNLANPFIAVVDNNSAGPYTVFITALNGCSSSTVVQVAGYNFPVPTPTISGAKKICLNSRIVLRGSGGASYLWNGPANFTSHNQDLDFLAGNIAMSGIYTLTVRNESNCAASSTIQLKVYPLPVGAVGANHDKTCVPLCVDFSFTQANNIAPIVKTDLVVSSLYASDSVFSYCIRLGGTHLIKAFFTDTNGCVNSSTLALTAFPQPIADFEYYPQNPIENIDEVIFTNTSIGYNLYKFSWFFNQNNGPQSQDKNPSMVYLKEGSFPVAMIATNAWGCADTVVKTIVVGEDFSVYVPDAFTPNSDGKNDIFQPKGVGIASYNLQVFNRWGEKMFQSNDFLKGWDGTFKGGLCKMDVYTWKIDVTSNSGKTKNLQGHITLL